jgi:ADP-sugar diphosphatase
MLVVDMHGKFVPIVGENAEQVIEDPKFKLWIKEQDPAFDVEQIEVQATTWAGTSLKFATLSCQLVGAPFPWTVFLRGGSVAVLVLIKTPSEVYSLVVHQACFPVGLSDFVSIPAGMLDNDGNFAGVAAREIKEETGQIIEADNLVEMGFCYLSPGGSDEGLTVYLAQIEMSEEEVERLQKQTAGKLEEGELIVLEACKFEDLLNVAATDSKAHIAYALWKKMTER